MKKTLVIIAALAIILIVSLSAYSVLFVEEHRAKPIETVPKSPTPSSSPTPTSTPIPTPTPTPSPTSTPTPTPSPTPTPKTKPPRFVLEVYGNANLDESIDQSDVKYIRDIIEGKAKITRFADANRDGIVDQKDESQILALLNGTASYIWILDGNGDPVKVRLPVKRIGVEYLSNTELMLILGVEDRVVAVDFAPYQLRHFYFPKRADEIKNLGNMHRPDYEFVLSLNLDVLFTFSFDIAEKKQKLPGVDVVFLGLYWPDVIDINASRFIQGVMKAGYILGKADRARAYVNWLLDLIDMIKSRTAPLSEDKKPRVLMTALMEYLREPEKRSLRAYTRIDPLSQMCILAGGKPIAEELPEWLGKSYFVTVDLEWVLKKNPEYIFIHTVRYTYGGVTQLPAYGYDVNDIKSLNATWFDIMSRPLLSGLSAVANKRVYIIAGDFRNNGMGSVLGAVYLAKILQPELFKDMNPKAIHQEYITKWMGLNYDLNRSGTFLYPPLRVDGIVIGVPQR
ncbi:MAG: ABC transporter substrate-binding protein [Nitrososphaerota archaeon]|nr:ABC transporter substrate-binding protein [Nitrososphaerota archaeon]